MNCIEILKDLTKFQLDKYPNYRIIGTSIYFLFDSERYAKVSFCTNTARNSKEIVGVDIAYVSRRVGLVDHCELLFADVFIGDTARATINTNNDGIYEWYQKLQPSRLDLNTFSENIELYFEIIGKDLVQEKSSSQEQLLLMAANIQKSILLDVEKKILALEKPSMPALPTASVEKKEETLTEENASEESETEQEVSEPIAEPLKNASSEDVISVQEEKTAEEHAEEEVLKSVPGEFEVPLENGFDEVSSTEEETAEAIENEEASISEETMTKTEESVEEPAQEEQGMSWEIGYPEKALVTGKLKETEDGYQLEISGSGEMDNLKLAPWAEFRRQIVSVVIEDGITNIGDYAFKGFTFLKEVMLGKDIHVIGKSAFEYCPELKEVKLPEELEIISDFAFSGCDNLKRMEIPDRVKEIKDCVFEDPAHMELICNDVKNIRLGADLDSSHFTVTTDKNFWAEALRNQYLK